MVDNDASYMYRTLCTRVITMVHVFQFPLSSRNFNMYYQASFSFFSFSGVGEFVRGRGMKGGGQEGKESV